MQPWQPDLQPKEYYEPMSPGDLLEPASWPGDVAGLQGYLIYQTAGGGISPAPDSASNAQSLPLKIRSLQLS